MNTLNIIVRWFNNDTHSGQHIANPEAVTVSGTYYAFYYDTSTDCYNKTVSTAEVTITTNCSQVKLSLKVALQGAIAANGIMRNDLQIGSGGVTFLPVTDPYGNNQIYNEIGNALGTAGNIADWVQVEIRSAANPATILETKSLLLKTNGQVVDQTGAAPSFTPQAENVHITVKHRNHLAVMSPPVPFAAGTVDYDFTTGLDKSFNDGTFPEQMILTNGVWCMIGGDSSNDGSVVNTDVSSVRNAFNKGDFNIYSSRDHNLDGSVLNTDVAIQRNRFNKGYYSILTKFQ